MLNSSFIPLQHDSWSWSAALLSQISQSIPSPPLEWGCLWEVGASATGEVPWIPKILTASGLSSNPFPAESAWLVVAVVGFVSSFLGV